MTDGKNQLVLAANRDIAIASDVQGLMRQIRPEWQAKSLVQRVEKFHEPQGRTKLTN
jgi:hypothetical protein